MKRLLPLLLVTACMSEPTANDQFQPPDEISWSQALQLFKACKVDTAFQDHQRNVLLTLKDGSQFSTVEPGLDDIFHTDKLAPGCPEIGIITE